jgi:hypothetical protein
MKPDEGKQPETTASPDFPPRTIKTLARRAAFLCSNPDCRASTVGPNSDPQKSTTIGEAAHILGARPASKRFREDMTEGARAAITNGIWLCRNCHKQVDADENRYTSDVLFAWREQHERFVLSELGNSADRIRSEHQEAILEQFASYPPLVRRIVIDKPNGWEWKLTAELLRYLNAPLFRRLSDLREGLCAAAQEHINEEQAPGWVRQRFAEMSRLMAPLEGLFPRLNQSWGEPGEPGSAEDIHHICKLLNASLEQIVQFEERVYFTNGPESYKRVLELFRNIAGSQAEKLAEIPEFMDDLVLLSESEPHSNSGQPRKVERAITLEAPEERLNDLIREIRRAEGASLGCLAILAATSLPIIAVLL